MGTAQAAYTDWPVPRLQQVASSHAPMSGLVRVGALLAGGSLLAAAAVLVATAGAMSHPGQQLWAALLTAVVGAAVCWSVVLSPERTLFRLLLFSSALTLVVILPLVRYIPSLYTFLYNQDYEALFPPLWPYSIAIPLLVAMIGELALPRGEQLSFSRTPMLLALVAACLCLFFSFTVAGKLAAGVHLTVPERSLVAYGASIGLSSSIILGGLIARKGIVWAGVGILMTTGLFLEMMSIRFYDGIPVSLTHTNFPVPLSLWVPLLGGTIPGALSLLVALSLLWDTYLVPKHYEAEPLLSPS